MARVPARGTLLKVTISASLTSIGQVTSLGIGDTMSQVVDTEALDDSSVTITKTNIGTVEQDDITADILYDPDSATHQFITDTIIVPANFPNAGSVVFADATPASATFSAVGYGFGASVAVKDVLKGRITIKCNGPVVWPT